MKNEGSGLLQSALKPILYKNGRNAQIFWLKKKHSGNFAIVYLCKALSA
jgi:hypothetical protein